MAHSGSPSLHTTLKESYDKGGATSGKGGCSTSLDTQQQAYQEEQRAWVHSRWVDTELRAAQHHGEQATLDTELTELRQCMA
jgi:mannose/cellobiose epimerase-like protein (N-acyl-D-glucosamine 2-epimerase family)